MAITIEESKLLAIFIQTLLYGAYVVLFVMTCWVLIARRPHGQPIHKTMLGIAITMFVLATMHVITNFIRIVRAFVYWRSAPGGPGAFFELFSEFTQMFGSTFYIAQTLVGDSILLYRCYVVWGNQFQVIAFPVLLLSGSTATGIGILYSFSQIVPGSEIFVPQLGRWILSFFSLTLATNIIGTSLLAFRIWSVTRSTAFPSRSLRPVLRLVIESGAIYSITLVTLLVLYNANSWFQYVLIDAVSPIVGLVFSTIIVRVGLGLTALTEEMSSLSSHTVAPTHSHHSRTGRSFYGLYNSKNGSRIRGHDQKSLPQLEPFEAAPNHMSAVGIAVQTKTTPGARTEEDLRADSGTEGGGSSLDELEKQMGHGRG